MARTARALLPGYPAHVVQRGHNREPCFFDSQDRELYLGLLQEFATSFRCSVHAYVLMTNHVHLLLTPSDSTGVSEVMRRVNQRYVRFINHKMKRTGSLWDGRFKASVVDSQDYFFTCQRYVELNPVRAGLSRDPSEYPWSSYLSNAAGRPSTLIAPHDLYLALGADDPARRAAYRALFAAPISVEDLGLIRAAIAGGKPLGSRVFAQGMTAVLAALQLIESAGQGNAIAASDCVPVTSPVKMFP